MRRRRYAIYLCRFFKYPCAGTQRVRAAAAAR